MKVTQREEKYKIEDKIWLKVNKKELEGKERSLKRTYKGPYEIIKKGLNQIYKLNISNLSIHNTFHSCRLKLFYQTSQNENLRLKTTEIRDEERKRQEQRSTKNYQAVQTTDEFNDTNRRA